MFHKHNFKYNEDKTAIFCECGKINNFKHNCNAKEIYTEKIKNTNLYTKEEYEQNIKYFMCECGKMKIVNVTAGKVIHDDFRIEEL